MPLVVAPLEPLVVGMPVLELFAPEAPLASDDSGDKSEPPQAAMQLAIASQHQVVRFIDYLSVRTIASRRQETMPSAD